jgi:pimeloyl-ACP methyl ester carboxylesterase
MLDCLFPAAERTSYPMSAPDTIPQWLERPDGNRVAYHARPGKGPGVVFLGGYASDMTGTKAMYLDSWCQKAGRAYLRLDYLGHGQSTGTFEEGTLGRWADDALAAIDALTQGPQILVGSSMGGWIMLLAALARPERVAGLVGIAAAPDFSQDIWWGMSAEQQDAMVAQGKAMLDEGHGAFTVTHAFIEDGRRHLVMRAPMKIDVPVRLLQGMQDTAVPWPTAQAIADRLAAEDVVVTLIKDGDHRLSRDQDLARLGATLEELLAVVEG